MNKTVVMVVEDDLPIMNLIVTTLKTHDYKYLTANNGQNAIMQASSYNPDIILLDEPTSALDSFNEEKISQALNNLFQWKTVIIVAHRLQTVKSADRILLFEEWKVIEDWTHQSLTRKNWKYKKMLDLQSGF